MNDFTDLVKKLNAISNNEETVDATGETVYKPVEEAVAGTRETANILKVFNELEEAAKPDYIDLDGDGDKEESMKKAAKDKKAEIFNPVIKDSGLIKKKVEQKETKSEKQKPPKSPKKMDDDE